MLSSILLVLGIAVLGMAFRTFNHPVAQRLSILCVLAVSFLIGYLPTGKLGCWPGRCIALDLSALARDSDQDPDSTHAC